MYRAGVERRRGASRDPRDDVATRTGEAPGMSERALAAAVDAARAAGEIAMRYYRTGFDVSIKSDLSPVTQADREAEAAIVEILGRACPDYGMLGEELGSRGNQETRWIIDPIDGTRNFVRH